MCNFAIFIYLAFCQISPYLGPLCEESVKDNGFIIVSFCRSNLVVPISCKKNFCKELYNDKKTTAQLGRVWNFSCQFLLHFHRIKKSPFPWQRTRDRKVWHQLCRFWVTSDIYTKNYENPRHSLANFFLILTENPC